MLLTHFIPTTRPNAKPEADDNPIGHLLTDFNTQGLYTKTLQSVFVQVGNSLRNLTEFPQYEAGVNTGKNNYALVQFKNIDNYIKLTTTYPFIYLLSLGNTLFDEASLDSTKSYLGIRPDKTVINTVTPEFSIPMLGDVANITLNASMHNYVLASNFHPNSVNNNKDPFTTAYYYTWSLKPENTRLLRYEDIRENTPVNTYHVIRTYKPSDGRGLGGETFPFSIRFDATPRLSNNLNANGYALYNHMHNTQVVNANTSLFTLSCDCNTYTVFIINCTNVNVLSIEFSYQSNTTNNLIPIALILNDFEGAVKFSNNVEFENGQPLSLLGKNHIINCLISSTGNAVKARILQKATNLSKVPL